MVVLRGMDFDKFFIKLVSVEYSSITTIFIVELLE